MISLTRHEFDAVSSALLEALHDAERREPPMTTGLRARSPASRRESLGAHPASRAIPRVVARS